MNGEITAAFNRIFWLLICRKKWREYLKKVKDPEHDRWLMRFGPFRYLSRNANRTFKKIVELAKSGFFDDHAGLCLALYKASKDTELEEDDPPWNHPPDHPDGCGCPICNPE